MAGIQLLIIDPQNARRRPSSSSPICLSSRGATVTTSTDALMQPAA